MKASTRRKPRIITLSAAALLAGVFLFSSIRLAGIFLAYEKNENQYEEMRREFIEMKIDHAVNQPRENESKPMQIPQIDFKSLQAINTEIIAWLWVENSPINYPVLKSSDNHKYLKLAYNGRKSILGSIFMDYRNNNNFTDKHTVIYGHNTKDGSMFGSLHYYEDPDFFNENRYFYIIDPDNTVRMYQIFSAYVTDAYSDTYTLDFSDDEDFTKYESKILARSSVDFESLDHPADLPINPERQIVTLSTCTSSGRKTERFVVHGYLVTQGDDSADAFID